MMSSKVNNHFLYPFFFFFFIIVVIIFSHVYFVSISVLGYYTVYTFGVFSMYTTYHCVYYQYHLQCFFL